MEPLPGDVWHEILQIGIKTARLDHADLCTLAIVNKHFGQLTQDPSLWATLLSRDFPCSFYHFFEDPSKALYKKEHQRKGAFKCWNESKVERLTSKLDKELSLHGFSLDEEHIFFPGQSEPSNVERIQYGGSSESYFSHVENQVINSETESNFVNVTEHGVWNMLRLHRNDPVWSHADQPRSRRQKIPIPAKKVSHGSILARRRGRRSFILQKPIDW